MIGQYRTDGAQPKLSKRGQINIDEIMARVPKSILEEKPQAPTEAGPIDLSVAENWLIRDEILEICKPGIQRSLDREVSLTIRRKW